MEFLKVVAFLSLILTVASVPLAKPACNGWNRAFGGCLTVGDEIHS